MADFLLPDLGEGLEEAEVVAWHVQVGSEVAIDQMVVEVETAKAVVEVPIPFAGTVTALHAQPGAVVQVGCPLISVATLDAGRFREPGAVTPDPVAAEESSGNVLIGYGTGAATSTRRRRVTPGARRAAASERPQTAPPTTAPAPAPAGVATATLSTRVISPLVRKLARDAELELTTVAGTGPAGIIRRTDIEDAIRARQSEQAIVAQPVTAMATGFPNSTAVTVGETRLPLRGLRRTVADKLTRSRREIPEATVWVDVDATDLLRARAALNAGDPEHPVSLLALLARFAVLALRRYPELNSHIKDDEIVIPPHINLGFAAQTDRGLIVPVIRDAHRLSTRGLSAALAAQTAAARAGRLGPADLTGGTVTVNNYGVFGVDGSAAIINYPEVAIIGMGRIIDRPWVVDGQLAVRKVSQLTLAFDHRVCDGSAAGGFLRTIADCIEKPIIALGDA